MDQPAWDQISQEGKSFVRKLLEKNPITRLTAELALKDPWIQKYSGRNDVDLPTLSKTLNNMRTFRAGMKLQEATW